ncbi:sugar phosphate isomerase/epimerase [Alkalihalophilus pseudofirmus]|uniref:Sugar phosphate isomerase/epimerase n=1 Tax=Alkalihalophilus pseudofirmus TaxID=79885 RepID=A0AAJ2KZA6_ALKPS|nr:sugar phosphate isomerase/epimerase [Alkalihalophilus pseudofirmus]MDV2884623.1 sugar phosphate isomerase/epimerase [Alkalihalophilus pseudofirmus]WEG18864.1 sugar phosphate isomerase/epimerase [Alkalihalophilus pseudofirmus]
MKVAIQLFTLRDSCNEDFVGTLRKVSELGYDGVEFAGHWGGLEARELKGILDELSLQAAGSHVPLHMLENELEDVIQYQKEINSRYITCPILPEDRRGGVSEYSQFAQRLNEIGKVCSDNGIQFSYHNHAFELEDLDGRQPLRILLDETDPKWVNAELDIYWLTKAGENPLEWINHYKGRVPLLHLKDMTNDSEQFFAELGTGVVDVLGAIEEGKQAGVDWFVVEQDQTKKSPFESVKISMDYLKSHHLL